MIEFRCGKCGHTVRAKDEDAGNRGRCPACGWIGQIPALEPGASPQALPPQAPATPSLEEGMIKFPCAVCGKKIAVKAENAGKRVRCPRCKTVCVIPVLAEKEPPAETGNLLLDALAEDAKHQSPVEAPPPLPPPPVAVPQAPPLPPPVPSAARRPAPARRSTRGDYVDDSLTGGDWLLAILCNGIAFILGIIWAVQGNPKGVKMIVVSMISGAVWGGIGFALRQ